MKFFDKVVVIVRFYRGNDFTLVNHETLGVAPETHTAVLEDPFGLSCLTVEDDDVLEQAVHKVDKTWLDVVRLNKP